jgi:hypothetical protein
VAVPHKALATVKPAMENRNIFLRPNFCDSQPESGVITTVATM